MSARIMDSFDRQFAVLGVWCDASIVGLGAIKRGLFVLVHAAASDFVNY